MTVFPQEMLIWQRFTNVSCLRTYYEKRDGTRLILNVKIVDSFDIASDSFFFITQLGLVVSWEKIKMSFGRG